MFIQVGTFSGGQPTEVPEPAMIAVIGVGLAGLGAMLRRRTALRSYLPDSGP